MSNSVSPVASLKAEFFNSVTHAFGILFSIIAIALLVPYSVMHGTAIHVLSMSIFGGSMLLLYTSSTLYHSIQHTEIKPLLRLLDHISIYFLIAGTYTPFLLLCVKGVVGWTFFGLVWGIAIFGMFYKIFFKHRFAKLSLILYLGMGWIAIFIIKPFIYTVPTVSLWLVVGGGLCYTLGTIFYVKKDQPYAHGVWHLFVLAGSICHFISIMFIF